MENWEIIYQCMEGRDWKNAQSAHGQFGGTGGEGQQAFGVGKLATLQAGQVTAEAEQIHVELL